MMNSYTDIDGGALPQTYDETPSAFTPPTPAPGAVHADGTPDPCARPADAAPSAIAPAKTARETCAMAEFHMELTPPQLIAIGTNINRAMTQAGQQIVALQRGMVCGAVALGFLLLEAQKVAVSHKMAWKKCFMTRGGKPKQGQFPFSYGTAVKYTQTAMAVYERAAVAGKAHDLFAQVGAYLQDAMSFDAPARGIPVLGELIDTDAISVSQVMVELGIIKPGRHAALPAEEAPQAPVLPGLDALMAQSWEAATRLVGGFRLFMEHDVARLSAQQRGTLRQELKALLGKLDDLEKAAPGL